MSIIEDLITKETMEYAKRIIKVKNECENIKKFLLGLGYDKWGANTKIIVNHQEKIVLLYTKCNSQKSRPSIFQSLIETANVLQGYTLIFGYLKTPAGSGGEYHTIVVDGHNIEIDGGVNLLKRVFGCAYDLYLTNCEDYIKTQLCCSATQLAPQTVHEQHNEQTPSERLTSQINMVRELPPTFNVSSLQLNK
jgi:hypothetical protein